MLAVVLPALLCYGNPVLNEWAEKLGLGFGRETHKKSLGLTGLWGEEERPLVRNLKTRLQESLFTPAATFSFGTGHL